MSVLLERPRFTVEEWSRMLIDPTKGDRYLETELGPHVADYLAWKGNEDGGKPETIKSYTYDLARLAVALADIPLADLTVDHLRAARDLHPPGSRYKVSSIYRDFGKWLYEEERTDTNVAGRLRLPKKAKPAITDLFTTEEKAAIVTAQTDIMDRVGVLLFFRAGLRKAELRELRVRDINLVERYVLVRRGKGGKARRVPIRGAVINAVDEYLLTPIVGLEREPALDDHVIAPWSSSHKTRRNPTRPMSQRGAHEWWYGCLQRAGIVDVGVTRGRRMHATRHTYATDLGRASGWNMVAVQKNLGHSSFALTVDTYTQFAYEDQENAVELMPEIEVGL